MKHEELAHVLRASAAISNETSFVLVGSQAVLTCFGDVTAICPDLHDLVVSKCAAVRDKDADFVRTLLANGSVVLATLLERITMLDSGEHDLQYIAQWAQRRAQEATP